MITPWAPAASAVRITAPRLWGSLSSSHTTMRGGSPFSRAMFRMSSTLAYSRTAAWAMTPWWEWVRLILSSLRRSASTTTMPFSRAAEAICPRAASCSPFSRKILSMATPARSASMTALRPSMIPSFSVSTGAERRRGGLLFMPASSHSNSIRQVLFSISYLTAGWKWQIALLPDFFFHRKFTPRFLVFKIGMCYDKLQRSLILQEKNIGKHGGILL